MSRLRFTRALPALLLAAAAALPVSAASPSPTTTAEVDALLERARQSFDLGREDAVLLRDRLREDWTADGRLVTTVERLILVSTDHAVDLYADLRVPFDSARQRLTVHALRTFRLSDRRWVESGPTARVETLPFAVDRAPDYATWRETMLLHDGVELPSVLETAYTLEDTAPHRPGRDGLWTVAREEPALRSELVLGFPPGSQPSVTPTVELVVGHDADAELDTLTLSAGPVGALPRPHSPDLAPLVPHLAWSSWPSWEALGRDLETPFAAALTIDEPLEAALRERLHDARTVPEKVRLVVALVRDSARALDEVDRPWWAPRPAARTFATAYGDRLDRVVLTAALLREAGVAADLAFRGLGPTLEDDGVAAAALLAAPGLWLEVEGATGWLDPSEVTATPDLAPVWGRPVWRPGRDQRPAVLAGGDSRLAVRLDLVFDGDAKLWKGTGVLSGRGALSPAAAMVGLADETRDQVQALAAALLPGASVTGANLESLSPHGVTAGFALEVPAGDRDPRGRATLRIGSPPTAEALIGHAALHTSDAGRTAPLELPAPLEVVVELHLDLGGLEPVYLPEPRRTTNTVGDFELSSSRDGSRVTVTRRLTLAKGRLGASDWPALRALLLAFDHERGRVVLFE